MKADKTFQSVDESASHLSKLHEERRKRKRKARQNRQARRTLSPSRRAEVLEKTGGRCHLCGGNINANEQWHADHVFADAQGGEHSVDNFLPAHSICDTYRWFYGPEELQWILKLGVWFRTRIERKDSRLALELAQKFVQHEINRDSR